MSGAAIDDKKMADKNIPVIILLSCLAKGIPPTNLAFLCDIRVLPQFAVNALCASNDILNAKERNRKILRESVL
jgi:hypothetical protein